MHDVRAGLLGDLSEGIHVDRYFTPADGFDPALGDGCGGDGLDRIRLCGVTGGEKEHAHGEILGLVDFRAECGRGLGEKREGDLREDAGAVACFHIRIHRAAMGHAGNGGQRVVEHSEGTRSVQVGDGAHAAVVVFVRKAVKRAGNERGAGMVKRIRHGKGGN